MVSDTQTGFVLTADSIDSPRDPSMLGRLMTIAMTMQAVATGRMSYETLIALPDGKSVSVRRALALAASESPGQRPAMTSLANHVGGTVRGYTESLADVENRAGLKGITLRVVRAEDGGPAFEGYATPRDMSRLAISMMRSYQKEVDKLFSGKNEQSKFSRMWLHEDGVCLLAADGPRSGRLLVATMTGAPDGKTCLRNAAKTISRDDVRISDTESDIHPGSRSGFNRQPPEDD